MATIYDIAKRANVSTTTVSRALNGHNDVKLSTRERLIRLAEDMGYQPNSKAKSLATKKTWSLGVLLIDDSDSGLNHTLFANIIDSISKTASKRGYDITFLSKTLSDSKLSYLEHVYYRYFDGVIIANTNIKDENVKELIENVDYIACIDQHNDQAICVNSQNREGMKITLNHLYNKGHREIIYIHGQLDNFVTQERVDSFKETAKNLGIGNKCRYIEGKYTSPQIAYDITRKIIDEGLPDAIVYSDDYCASGGLKCLIEHQIKVPEDVAIMGYDGVEIAHLLTPSLTTIFQDTDKIGEVVTEEIIKSIEDNRSNGYIIELPVYLINGETT
ncbi:MAG: LacI family DNA-binding transcriptional regulator [Candidatus Izemoplasmatales bacterium]